MLTSSSVPPSIQGVIFDLDGVLLDSSANMEASWEAVPEHLRKGVSYEHFRLAVGLPFKVAMKSLGLESAAQEIETFYRRGSLALQHLSVPFLGSNETLRELREMGTSLVLFTSKDCERTNSIIENFGWSFDSILCPDPAIPGKPSGIQLINLMEENGTAPSNYVYFGDSYHDFCAATDAEIPYRHCSWGFGERPQELNISNQVDSFDALIKTVRDL